MNKSLLFFGLIICLLYPAKSFSQFEEDENRILTEFIVMLKPSHLIEQLLDDIPAIKIKECLSLRMNIYLVERTTGSSAEDFLFALQQNPHVKLGQFNHRVAQRSLIP